MAGVSNTYTFNLSNQDLTLEAFSRVGIRGNAITRDYMIEAYRSLNLGLANLSNQVPNLWKIELMADIPLLEGVSEYDIPPEVMVMLDVYIRTTDGAGTPNDIILLPISRTDYASMPNKTQQGKPTSFWFARLEQPTVTIWPVPTEDGLYTLRYYGMRRVMDSNVKMGQTPDITVRYLEAITADLAARLAEKYMPEREDKLLLKAQMRLKEAQIEDRERVAVYISPDFSGYFTGT